jgi:hypothetical protein
VPASLSSLITVPARDISAALCAGGAASRRCLRQWLLLVPDPRKRAGRWHPLEFVLALAVCAFTAAGHDPPTAIAEWAADCSGEALLILGGRPDPLTGRVWPPGTRTFRRVLGKINADALNQALYGFLEVMPPAVPGELPEVTRHEREQRRAAAAAREPAVPGLLPHAAADGKTARGAVRPDGSQVHLLSAYHVTEDRTMAQREVDAKTNEIPELLPMLERLNLDGMVITADALHGQRETARKIREDLGAHYVMVIKANQPSLLEAITARLNGTDAEFADTTWTDQGKGHGRREKRTIRTAPRRRHRLAARRPGPAHPPRHRPHPRPVGRQGDRLRHHQPPRSHRRTPPPRHLRTPALGNRKQGTLRPRRHIPGGRTENPHRKPAQRPRRHPQPRHGSIPQERTRQHRSRPTLLRPRRPAHPRPLRIPLNRHQKHDFT